MPTLSQLHEKRSPREFFCVVSVVLFRGFGAGGRGPIATPGQNPDPNGPVVVPPGLSPTGQPPPGVQPQPSPDLWDRWGIQKVSENDDWTRHFRIGAMVGLNISANFSTKGTFNIPGNNAANGIYDDGYVRTDNTGNAFGYNRLIGVTTMRPNCRGSSLTMHNTTSLLRPAAARKKAVRRLRDSTWPTAAISGIGASARIGWDFGFGLLPINITDNSPMSATVNQTRLCF